jgi:hypothetical protein
MLTSHVDQLRLCRRLFASDVDSAIFGVSRVPLVDCSHADTQAQCIVYVSDVLNATLMMRAKQTWPMSSYINVSPVFRAMGTSVEMLYRAVT